LAAFVFANHPQINRAARINAIVSLANQFNFSHKETKLA
jgi:hypothetical protein